MGWSLLLTSVTYPPAGRFPGNQRTQASRICIAGMSCAPLALLRPSTQAATSPCLKRIVRSYRGGPVRKQLIAAQVAVDRQLHETVHMQLRRHLNRDAGTQVRDRASGIRHVRQGALVAVLVTQINLQLRNPCRIGLIAQAE